MASSQEVNGKMVGQRIRSEREKLGLSREGFAEIVGLSDYYVGQLERGERQMSLPVLIKICNSLHLSSDYLLYGKTHYHGYTVKEDSNSPYIKESSLKEIMGLLERCSPKELELIKKLIMTMMPYLGNN